MKRTSAAIMRFDLMLLPRVETGGEEGTTIKEGAKPEGGAVAGVGQWHQPK